jgi:hypothetical protein
MKALWPIYEIMDDATSQGIDNSSNPNIIDKNYNNYYEVTCIKIAEMATDENMVAQFFNHH